MNIIYEFIHDEFGHRFQYWIFENGKVLARHLFRIELAQVPAVALTMMEIQLQEQGI